MPNDFADELGDIDFGADFEEFAQGLLPVAVTQIDPDTGTNVTRTGVELECAEGVPASKLKSQRQPATVGDGGEVGESTARFVFRRDQVPWELKARDQIKDYSGKVFWIESVDVDAFGALANCECVIRR